MRCKTVLDAIFCVVRVWIAINWMRSRTIGHLVLDFSSSQEIKVLLIVNIS